MILGYVLDDTLDKNDGVQQAMISIAEEMRLRGHEVHYIVAETKRSDLQNVHSMSNFISAKFNGNSIRTPLPTSKKKIKAMFSNTKFDVLHIQMPYSPFLSARIVSLAPKNIAIFGTFHILPYGAVSSIGTKILGAFLRKNLQRFTTLYAVSQPALEFMGKTFSVHGSVLPNPIKYDYYHSFSEQKTKTKSIVFVGRFDERKGVLELVEAYSQLPKQFQNEWKLIMCGQGPLFERVQKKVLEDSLNVELPGFVSDDEKAKYLARSEIAVFPSISGESFGIVLTEAMSAGAGVVLGGNNPGYASVLGEWQATLFDPKNITSFSKVLQYFMENTHLRHEIGSNQHQAVLQYDIKKVADRLEGAYKEQSSQLNN